MVEIILVILLTWIHITGTNKILVYVRLFVCNGQFLWVKAWFLYKWEWYILKSAFIHLSTNFWIQRIELRTSLTFFKSQWQKDCVFVSTPLSRKSNSLYLDFLKMNISSLHSIQNFDDFRLTWTGSTLLLWLLVVRVIVAVSWSLLLATSLTTNVEIGT